MDFRTLVHELHLRQAELETRNEQLLRAQEALARTNSRGVALFQRVPLACVAVDPLGVVCDCNQEAEILFARSREMLLGQPFVRLSEPGNQVALYEHLERAKGAQGSRSGQFRMRRDGGETFPAVITTRALVEESSPGLLLCCISDEPSLRRTLARTFGLDERYHRLFSAVSSGLLVIEAATGRIVEANACAARLVRSSPTAMRGMAADELFVAPSGESVLQMLSANTSSPTNAVGFRTAPSASGSRFVCSLRLADGGRVSIEAVATVLDEAHTLVTLQDSSVRARSDSEPKRLSLRIERWQRLDALDRLAGGVAHEINNVLSVVLSLSSVLAHEWSTHPAAVDLREVVHAARRGRSLVQRLLGFARTDASAKTRVRINELAQEMLAYIEGKAGPSVQTQLSLDPDSPAVLADLGQLQTLFVNLGTNVIDAMGGRPGTVTVRTSTIEARDLELSPLRGTMDGPASSQRGEVPTSGRWLRVDVEDSGPGFSPEALEHAFEPFFTTKPPGKGNGLGLSMVWSTMREHGGFASVQNRSELGAKVSLWFPIDPAPAVDPAGVVFTPPTQSSSAPPGNASVPPEIGEDRGEPSLVLVIDDEPMLRTACRRILERLHYRVLVADSGENGLLMLEEHLAEVRLVLLDIVMPGLSGLETLARLRRFAKTPVLLMSGYSRERVPSALADDPTVSFLPKPFGLSELRAAIESLLGVGSKD